MKIIWAGGGREKGDDLVSNQTNKQTHILPLVVTRQQTTHFTLKTELTRLPNQFFFFSPPSVQQPDMFLAIKENKKSLGT
jgi:hypothetical protein